MSEISRQEVEALATQLADRDALLAAVIGPGHAHAFTWDIVANAVRSGEGPAATTPLATRDLGTILQAIHPEDAIRVQGKLAAIRTGQTDTLLDEIRYRPTPDARWGNFVVSARATRGDDGTTKTLSGVALDLSPFRDAQQEASRSEHRFRELAEAMPQIVYVTNADGTVAYSNSRWAEVTGLASAGPEVLHEVVHPDDLPSLTEAWGRAVASETELTAEFRLRRVGETTYRWFLSRSRPIRDETGRVIRWYGTSTDIEDVRATRQALEASDRAKDEFLATLAHELRNPLAPIRNAVSILQRSESQRELPWALGVVDRQVRQMTRLIDDLMDVSRITQGKLELQLESIDLGSIVRDGVELSGDVIAEGAHPVTIVAPDDAITIEADAVRLSQVMANLVNNAAKYSDHGSAITITLSSADGEACVEVTDRGVGIPPDQLDGIFGMFAQVADSVSRAKGGLGIGLALVRRLVELHGGTVTAASGGRGQGSTFTVRLPLSTTHSVSS